MGIKIAIKFRKFKTSLVIYKIPSSKDRGTRINNLAMDFQI